MRHAADSARTAADRSAHARMEAELSDEELEMVIGGLSRVPLPPLDPPRTGR